MLTNAILELQHRLIRGRFVPPRPQRELRELTRHRLNVAAKRAQCTNQIERMLEETNIKLAGVISDLRDLSLTLILQALVADLSDPEALAVGHSILKIIFPPWQTPPTCSQLHLTALSCTSFPCTPANDACAQRASQ